MEIKDVDINTITVSAQNTRKRLDAGQEDSSLEDLAQSIRQKGLLSPIVVREVATDSYELIAGQRRLLACKRLGMQSIPAIVRTDLDDTSATAVSLIENVHRADMHPLDKAQAFHTLVEHYGKDYERASRETGVTTGTIKKYLALLELPVEIQQRVSTSEGPAKIDALHTLTRTFRDAEQMVEVHEQISGFTQTIQKEILKRSNGVVSRVPELVQEAMEGAFKTQTCKGLKGKFMCEYIPEELADSIIQLVERYTAGGVSIKRIIEKLNSI